MDRFAKLLLFALLALSSFSAYGVKRRATAADSLLVNNYIEKIRFHLTEPVVLKMTDTLAEMGRTLNNVRWQTLALAFNLDYYYFTDQADSMFVWADRVMDFAYKNRQPIYYYFTWQRKITYYIRYNRINSALSETSKMQNHAIEHGYYPGQIDACRMMGRIYFNKIMYAKSAAVFEKAISLLENTPEDIEIVNKHSLYDNYAQALIFANQCELVKGVLDKALSLCTTDSQRGNIYRTYCTYYSHIGNLEKAKEYMEKVEEIFHNQINAGKEQTMLQNKALICIYEKDYEKASEYLNTLYSTHRFDKFYFINEYAILTGLGQQKEANALLNKWRAFSDSIRIADINDNVSESIVMMDVNRLKSENQRAEIELRGKWLMYLYIAAGSLFLIVISLIFVLKRAFRVNNELKENERNLSQAITKMEEVSQLKQLFLQQLSHEIRTPLNAIVGFSYIIAEAAKEEEYSKAITAQSQELIKIVNQALK